MKFIRCLLSSLVIGFSLIIVLQLFTGFSKNVFAEVSLNINEFQIPTENSFTSHLASDSEGNIWFAEEQANKIGKLSKEGNITEIQLDPPNSPHDIAIDSRNNIWFTEISANAIGRITAEGAIHIYSIPTNESYPFDITAGSDGNIWFTEYRGNKIGKISQNGIITEYSIPSQGGFPYGITESSDGNIWFTEENLKKIGRLTPNGEITEFQIPTSGNSPQAITSTPDGNIWFIEENINNPNPSIGRITPQGVITEFLQISFQPFDITSGPLGRVWFTEYLGNKIGSIAPDGTINEYTIPELDNRGITADINGGLWYAETSKNKIAHITLSDAVPVPTITPTPTPAPQITLTDYKQTDPRWASARLYNSSNCGTMYSYGCAITSVADVFYSYGKTLLANMQLTPGILNNALGNNSGFNSECGIIWSIPAALVNLGAPALTRRQPNGEWNAGEGSLAIDDALNAGNLPIIGINTKFGTHFLVVSAKLPDVNGKPDYKLVDPAQYPFVANNPGNSGKSLSQVYGGFDKVFETIVYKNHSTPQKTLTVRAHSPVQLLITDPDGNQTGYDVESESINENIPNSSYGIEPGIAPVDGSAPAMGETKYFQQIDPSDGDYTVQLIGTGNGSYTLDVTKTDEESNTSTQVIKGYAQSGVTESYQLAFTSDATEQPTLEKEVTFDVLKTDIKTLYNQKQIKSQLVFSTLKLQAEIAEKASEANRQPLGNKLAILALKTFQLELKKVRGKSITEDAYQILNNDVNKLIQSLQGDTNTHNPTPTPGGS